MYFTDIKKIKFFNNKVFNYYFFDKYFYFNSENKKNILIKSYIVRNLREKYLCDIIYSYILDIDILLRLISNKINKIYTIELIPDEFYCSTVIRYNVECDCNWCMECKFHKKKNVICVIMNII
jgi:hypothetical protein